jgi:hypothetical protein
VPILRTLWWWLRGERSLAITDPPLVGRFVRPYAEATVYRITRLVPGRAGMGAWGRPTDGRESGPAAREYVQRALATLAQQGRPLTRSAEYRLLWQVPQRFGPREATAAAAIATALYATPADAAHPFSAFGEDCG